MIAKLIALAQNARTRPPGPISAVVGAALLAGGIALVQRYHTHLIGQIQGAGVELEQLDEALIVRKAQYDTAVAQVDQQRRRVEDLRAEAAKLEQLRAEHDQATGLELAKVYDLNAARSEPADED